MLYIEFNKISFMEDFFNFEEKEYDIPFYNNIPKLSKFEWGLLALGLILFYVVLIVPIIASDEVNSLLFCLVLLVPTLYVLKGNWSLMFRKIRRNDITPILIVVFLQAAYSFGMLYILSLLGLASKAPVDAEAQTTTIISFLSMAIQLMGEELFKVILLILVMHIVYRFLNRKQSIIFSLIITLAAFGLLHAGFYGGAVNVLLIQGLGSIFEMYLYLKTKNIMVTYASHLLYDCIPIFFELLTLI